MASLLLIMGVTGLVAAAPPRASSPSATSLPAPNDVAAWREDLRFLATELPALHKDFFRRTGRAEFEAAVRNLDVRIPRLARHQIIVAMARIVAMAPDGHTGISGLLHDSPAGFRYLPIAMYQFRDGLYIYAADPKYGAAVGGKVVRIGKAGIDDAIAAVGPLIPRDNVMAIRDRAPLYLACPEVLHALGLIDSTERVPFTVEKNGRRMKLEIAPSPAPKPVNDNWALGQRFSKLDNWIDGRSASKAPAPLWLRDPTNYFWSTYLEDSRTLYAQYNEVSDKSDTAVADWVKQIQAMIDAKEVDRLVLDLRWNTGGNNYLNKPLLLTLIKSAEVNQPGKLFAIIGRRNFSAVQNLINDLDNYTNVVFVGEPTAGNPNFFGDVARFTLPNSKLIVGAATLWWQDVDPRVRRQWTGPDLAVELSFADYRGNRDPALALALGYRPQKPLTDRMQDAVLAGDTAAAIRLHDLYKADPVNAYGETESAVNALGYRLLGMKRPADAVAILALNVRAYPGSPNAYDSLGEAYLAAGDKARAAEQYRKVLQLDPGNANATEALRRIEAQG